MLNRRRIRTGVRSKQSVILTAVTALVAAPLAVFGGNAAYQLVQDNGSGPISAAVQTVSLSDSTDVVVDDAAIATQGILDELHPQRGVVKEITSDTEFSQFALTWHGSSDVASFVRAQRADGSWSEWFSAEPDYTADVTGNGLNGTELIFVEPTKRVQVSTHGLNVFGEDVNEVLKKIPGADKLDLDKAEESLTAAGAVVDQAIGQAEEKASGAAAKADETKNDAAAAADDAVDKATEKAEEKANEQADGKAKEASSKPTAWADIEPVADEKPLDEVSAVLIDGQAAASDIDPIVDAKNATGMPKVITRAGWGANEANRCQGVTYDDKLKAATVHHTAGSNNYTEAQAKGIVRGIYQYHGQTLGWCDVGYNALVDKFGNIYEGRYGGLDKNVQGAHAGGFNRGTFGISMMGDYSSLTPSQAALNSVGNMIGWRLSIAGVDPLGKTTLVSGGTSYSKYSGGTPVTLPNIFAHRDVGSTTCPGDAGYAQMDTIRSIADRKYKQLSKGIITNDGATGSSDSLVDALDKLTGTDKDKESTETESTTASKSSSASTSQSSTSSAASSSASASDSATSEEPTEKSESSSAASSSSAVAGPTGNSTADAANEGTSTDAAAAEPTGTSNGVSPSLNPGTENSDNADTVAAISGARSMLASALGLMGAPGLGETADAILATVGRSVENGPSISDLPLLVEKILSINAQNDLAAEWRNVSEKLGPVLGNAMTGIQTGATVSNADGTTDTLRYVKFSSGVITDSDATGTNALWGPIADAWAKQGFELGKLGAPIETQTVDGTTEKAVFQNGTLTLDRNTGEVTTDLN